MMPKRLRKSCLLIISILFFALVAPRQLPIVLATVLANYIIYTELATTYTAFTAQPRLLLILCIALNLGSWVFFGINSDYKGFPYLIGGGVIPFLAFDTNFKAYRVPQEKYSMGDYFLYNLFFPRLFVGPFSSISTFYNEDFLLPPPKEILPEGWRHFIQGGFQFTFFGVRLLELAGIIATFLKEEITMLSSWLMVLAFILGVYHTLAGIARAGQGVALMYGINFTTGWNYPYRSVTITQFSRSFLGSLQLYLNRNIYKPIAAKRKYPLLKCVAVLLIGGITGLWIDFSLGFLIWGLILGSFLLVENILLKEQFLKMPKWLKRTYTFIVMIFAFTFAMLSKLGWPQEVISGLFRQSVSFENQQIRYYFGSYFSLILLGVLFASNLPKRAIGFFEKHLPRTAHVVGAVFNMGLFVLLTSLLV